MKFKNFSQQEKEAYRRGKIAGYYKSRNVQRIKQKQKNRYGDFDVEESYNKAVERSQREIEKFITR